MRLNVIVACLMLVSGILFCSCKIQEAPGAYAQAEGRVKKNEIVKKEPVKVAEPVAKPEVVEEVAAKPEVVEKPQPKEEPKVDEVQDLVKAPAIVEKKDTVVIEEKVEEKIDTPAEKPVEKVVEPAPVVVPAEKEVTRAEEFTVVVEEEKSLLKHYNVVIGSFGIQANAERLKTLESVDYTPVIVKNETGMFRVILASFADYQSAKAEIEKVKNKYVGSWVLVSK